MDTAVYASTALSPQLTYALLTLSVGLFAAGLALVAAPKKEALRADHTLFVRNSNPATPQA